MALADMGFGITKEVVTTVVRDYVTQNSIQNPFSHGAPGKDWWQRFMKRWPCLSEHKSQHLSKSRADASHADIINSWFNNLETLFSRIGLNSSDPQFANRIWNCDETAFCTSANSIKILARGVQSVHENGGGSGREHSTVHCAASASGKRLPPFILYKGKNLYKKWTEGGPAGALYGTNESGWMDASVFLSWFNKLFVLAVSYLSRSGPVVLFMDGHHSHISLELIKTAKANNITLQCLPPNTMHITQPLDVGVFAPLKKAWKAVLKQYKLDCQ